MTTEDEVVADEATIEDDELAVTVRCPECGTETDVPVSDLEETITTHNERRHDGEDVAGVDPELLDAVRDMVADDLGLR
jgi:hypothetical protein